MVADGNYNVLEAMAAAKELLMKYPDIDGIFGGNDLMAVGVLKAAEQLKIKIPEELSLIGFDGIQLGKLTSPEITTMAQPIYQLGNAAAELILKMIEGKSLPKLHYQFPTALNKGQSTRILEVTKIEE